MKAIHCELIIKSGQNFAPPRYYDELFGTFDVEYILDNVDDLGEVMVGVYKHTQSIRCSFSFAKLLISNGVFTRGVFNPDREEFLSMVIRGD